MPRSNTKHNIHKIHTIEGKIMANFHRCFSRTLSLSMLLVISQLFLNNVFQTLKITSKVKIFLFEMIIFNCQMNFLYDSAIIFFDEFYKNLKNNKLHVSMKFGFVGNQEIFYYTLKNLSTSFF